ncbi:hypothetical protein DFH11DRAFT_1876144 [Phellopilus nigrolimitatus]|nr:hypothetical protein DFH11DRAFT_1876144 [Phellopilus nigrolimitatus]
MQQTDNSEDYSHILEYGNEVLVHLSSIRGRAVRPASRSTLLGQHAAGYVADVVRAPTQAVSYIFHPKAATGHALVVRTITRARYLGAAGEDALLAVVEDERGAVHNLRVYNLHFGRDVANVLPAGAVLAIKEPYCEAAKESTSGIRSWKTTFPDDQVRSPSEELKDRGNDAFKNKLYRTAVSDYSNALQYEHDAALEISLLLNRAQAYLQLGSFAAAVSDAEQVIRLSSGQANEKALFRGARAFYFMGHFSDSLRLLEQLTAAFPKNHEAKALLAKNISRMEEQKTGKYDWISLVSEARKPTPRADVADYLGPVALSDGLLVAKNDIKAGELLLCNKAFEVLYPPELKDEERVLVYDATRSIIGQGEGWKLTQKIAVKILDNPSLGDGIFALGKDLKVYDEENSVENVTVIDGRAVIDVNLIDTIRESYATPFPAIHPLLPSNSPPAQGLGIWPLGSRAHIKHSCLPNAARSFLGDILILRACRDIPRGERISISHVHPALPLEERRSELARPPGTPCACAFCAVEEKEGPAVRQRRVELVQRVKGLSERAPAENLRTDPGRDEATRPDDATVREVAREPRFPLLEPLAYLFACYLYLGPNFTEDALHTNARYLVALGFSFEYKSSPDAANEKSGGGDMLLTQHGYYHPFIIKTLVQQSSVCWQLGKRRTANAWKRVAENATEIVAGHRRLFKEGYSGVYASLKWEL